MKSEGVNELPVNQVKMKYILFIILLISIYSCGHNHKYPSEEFTINTYTFNLNTSIKTTIFYQNNYYCLTKDHQFICLSDNFKINNKLTQYVNQSKLKFETAYLFRDTMVAEVSGNDDTTITYYLDHEFKWQSFTKSPLGEPLYEDSVFIANSCCMGEFGGALFFTERKSKRVYSCPAVCVTSINKIDSTYFITNSLGHGGGFTEILKINDPAKLYELKTDSLKNFCNWYLKFLSYEDGYAGMNQFEIGTQKILDTIGVLTETSFVYKNQLFNIHTDHNKTFITKVQRDSLLYIDTIFNKPLRKNRTSNLLPNDPKKVLYSFDNADSEAKRSGFLTINNDRVSIIHFINKKRKD